MAMFFKPKTALPTAPQADTARCSRRRLGQGFLLSIAPLRERFGDAVNDLV
jgi:hypothetical protein